jgi:hypothetical protein
MSNFLNISVLVLSAMVLVLAGMVGYVYLQQNKVMRSMSLLTAFVQSSVTVEDDRASVEEPPEPEATPEATPEAQAVPEPESELQESAEVELVDVDDLQTKTTAELKEMLTKKGIPYGKRDSKSVLLELLKASS